MGLGKERGGAGRERGGAARGERGRGWRKGEGL